MDVFCVMSGEARTDLDHIIYATTSKADAEMFAYTHELYDYSGNPYIETLDVAESEDNCGAKMEVEDAE